MFIRKNFRRLVIAAFLIFAVNFLTASALQNPEKGFLLGVVTLNEVPEGQETSASVVTDPENYKNIPGLLVMTVEVPELQATREGSSSSSMLDGLIVDTGDGKKQPADKPITWIPQSGASTLQLFLRENSERPIAAGRIPSATKASPSATNTPDNSEVIPHEPTPTPAITDAFVASPSFTMPPVAMERGVQVIHGDTAGNANEMSVTVDDVPARIVAAKPGTVYWRVPETVAPGAHEVVFTPGPGRRAVRLPMIVLGLRMTAERTHLIRGQSTEMTVTVTGPERLPASAWQSELPPVELVDLTSWQQRAGLKKPASSDPGTIILVLENASPETIRMGNRGARIVLQLHQQDFAKGSYVYKSKLQSLQGGAFSIHGNVTAFLKQVISQPHNR